MCVSRQTQLKGGMTLRCVVFPLPIALSRGVRCELDDSLTSFTNNDHYAATLKFIEEVFLRCKRRKPLARLQDFAILYLKQLG